MVGRKIAQQVAYMLRPLEVRISNVISRGVIRDVNDGARMQRVTSVIGLDRPSDDAERFQQYGFSSVPTEGSEAIVAHQGGNSKHPIVIATDDRRYRPTGKSGGHVCLYHYSGAIIEFSDSGDVLITPATGRNILVGGSPAVDGIIKGTTRNIAEQTFLTAFSAYVAAAGASPTAKAAMTAAITAFKTAAGAAVSTLSRTI